MLKINLENTNTKAIAVLLAHFKIDAMFLYFIFIVSPSEYKNTIKDFKNQ